MSIRYIDDFRFPSACLRLAEKINAVSAGRDLKIMEVCGTHTAAIRRHGIPSMLGKNIRLISGPGCPVCVTNDAYMANALDLAGRKGFIIATYHDMLRVPVKRASLENLKARGADIRPVSSAFETLQIAKEEPRKQVVFLAVGFETTAPATALLAKEIKKNKTRNLKIYSGHKTIPQALAVLGADKDLALDGFILPGHVSVIIGAAAYKKARGITKLPSVVCGFEAADILLGILRIIEARISKKSILENAYSRAVSQAGNVKARKLLKEVFIGKDSLWRGLGIIPKSGLFFRPAYSFLDAAAVFGLKETAGRDMNPRCFCADVLKGKIEPGSCPYFGQVCSPSSPKGPCMVSKEGSCRAFYEYR